MQRLTRYPLLIRQILQYTDPPAPSLDPSSAPRLTLSLPTEHAERESIANALGRAEQILEEVNETMRDRESRARLGEVSRELRIGKDRLDLTLPTHHLGPRKLLKEGVLTKAKSGRKLRVILCSDILLLLNESGGGGLYRVPLPVHELEIYTCTKPRTFRRCLHTHPSCLPSGWRDPRTTCSKRPRSTCVDRSNRTGGCEGEGGDQGGCQWFAGHGGRARTCHCWCGDGTCCRRGDSSRERGCWQWKYLRDHW
ncbi:hypothetical protein F5J12DRAFT_44573 [Pisolithus orientalis]|uniref:uncharacterized protein n=1 Tax=Pisolithus orientalis TaxID=936130 RepID=UPI002223F446|nr:uncharacterized protein F5J12DRAFT_44573 [Pisolithus orientalis]KAI6009623.1 hypothetical protein F5J12DRAFT_44573 [Pisolithus orientalis]